MRDLQIEKHHTPPVSALSKFAFLGICIVYNVIMIYAKNGIHPLEELKQLKDLSQDNVKFIKNESDLREFSKAVKYCPELYQNKDIVILYTDDLKTEFIRDLSYIAKKHIFNVFILFNQPVKTNKIVDSRLKIREFCYKKFDAIAIDPNPEMTSGFDTFF